jgi:hypothetical protein
MRADDRLSRDEAAREIGTKPKTLANWASLGIGPRPYKVRPGAGRNGAVFYLRADVEAFKSQQLSEAR